MNRSQTKRRLFSIDNVVNHSNGVKERVNNVIQAMNGEYLFSVNENDLCESLYSTYKINLPKIQFDEKSVDIQDDIRYEGRRKIVTEVCKIYIPYSGNIHILEIKPRKVFAGKVIEITVNEAEKSLKLELELDGHDPKYKKTLFEAEIDQFKTMFSDLVSEFEAFNVGLPEYISQTVTKRKQILSDRLDFVKSLGVPLKVKDAVSKTFSVPKPKLREKVVLQPKVNTEKYQPEPALDQVTFEKILRIINDVGKNFERMPSIYEGKEEEDLRDFILFVVDPNFEMGSASGETFNFTGKTDILLRYDSGVVFVAECKFWRGEKAFIDTIDQLLGYLTWRNSKVAIVIFVDNKEISPVLQKIRSTACNHPNYLQYISNTDESWCNFKFHLNGDRGRELDLSILIFHLPK